MHQFTKSIGPAAICLACLTLLGHESRVRADEAERFLREAPAQWTKHASEMARFQGQVEMKLVTDGRVVDHALVQIKRNAKYTVYIYQRSASQWPERASRGEVKAYNGRYAFELWRSAADQPWLISRVESSGGENATAFDTLAHGAAISAWLIEGRLAAFVGQPLGYLTSHKAFRILEASTTDQGYFTVRFECRHPMEERPFLPVQAGRLVVDPAHYYCLRSADLECLWGSGPGETHAVIEYVLSSQGLPIPVSVKEESKNNTSTGESMGSREARYELHEVSELPSDEEFTLAAFGFPEPESPAAAKTNRLLWLIVIGILCVAAGCALRFLFGKRRVGGPVTPT